MKLSFSLTGKPIVWIATYWGVYVGEVKADTWFLACQAAWPFIVKVYGHNLNTHAIKVFPRDKQ